MRAGGVGVQEQDWNPEEPAPHPDLRPLGSWFPVRHTNCRWRDPRPSFRGRHAGGRERWSCRSGQATSVIAAPDPQPCSTRSRACPGGWTGCRSWSRNYRTTRPSRNGRREGRSRLGGGHLFGLATGQVVAGRSQKLRPPCNNHEILPLRAYCCRIRLLPFSHAPVVHKVPLVASGLWRGILPVGPGRASCPAFFCSRRLSQIKSLPCIESYGFNTSLLALPGVLPGLFFPALEPACSPP